MSGGCWVVLGASSALARAFARAAAAGGAGVLLAGRDRDDLERTAADLRARFQVPVEVLAFDAADRASHDRFVQACRDRAEGTLNLFLAFGTMADQAAIDADPDLAHTVIEANYAGAVSILHRFAPVLEAQSAGRVVVIGSVAGERGRLKNYVYGSTKAGLHAYVQGLRARLWRAGVTVTLIKPGFLDTAMTWGQPGMFLVASPDSCARACLRLAEKGAEAAYFPRFWWGIMTIIRAIPERLFKRLSI